MISRYPSPAERALMSEREDYVIEMLFQLGRIAAHGGDQEMATAIEAMWARFRRRAAQRLAAPDQRLG